LGFQRDEGRGNRSGNRHENAEGNAPSAPTRER
jgi:hypothetical protein